MEMKIEDFKMQLFLCTLYIQLGTIAVNISFFFIDHPESRIILAETSAVVFSTPIFRLRCK